MKILRQIFYLLLVIVFIISCRPAKKIQQVIAPKPTDTTAVKNGPTHEDTVNLVNGVINKLNANHIEFNTFSAKIKVDYENNQGKQPDINVNVRMKKDSIIWISVTGPLGLEGLRLLITRDSVHILDKIANTYQQRSLEYLQEVSNIPFGFTDLENLIIGNPVFFNEDNITAYNQNNNVVSLLSTGIFFKNLLSLTSNYTIQKSKLDDIDPARNRTADLLYDDYEMEGGYPFSTKREITISEKSRTDIQLKYKQIDFNPVQNYPFGIPKKFKRINN